MPKALALLAPEDRPLVTHQAGTRQIEALRARSEEERREDYYSVRGLK